MHHVHISWPYSRFTFGQEQASKTQYRAEIACRELLTSKIGLFRVLGDAWCVFNQLQWLETGPALPNCSKEQNSNPVVNRLGSTQVQQRMSYRCSELVNNG